MFEDFDLGRLAVPGAIVEAEAVYELTPKALAYLAAHDAVKADAGSI